MSQQTNARSLRSALGPASFSFSHDRLCSLLFLFPLIFGFRSPGAAPSFPSATRPRRSGGLQISWAPSAMPPCPCRAVRVAAWAYVAVWLSQGQSRSKRSNSPARELGARSRQLLGAHAGGLQAPGGPTAKASCSSTPPPHPPPPPPPPPTLGWEEWTRMDMAVRSTSFVEAGGDDLTRLEEARRGERRGREARQTQTEARNRERERERGGACMCMCGMGMGMGMEGERQSAVCHTTAAYRAYGYRLYG